MNRSVKTVDLPVGRYFGVLGGYVATVEGSLSNIKFEPFDVEMTEGVR